MALTSPLHDTTTTTVHAALRGLAARQRVHAQNVANVETPGYTARRVDFESALRRAAASGTPAAVVPTTTKSAEAPGANGNNVQLDEETMALTETGLRYQLMTQAMNARFSGLRSAIGKGA